jgi:hypothetical protein
LLDADIDRQEGPGGALRLADMDLLAGTPGAGVDQGYGRDQ